MAFRESETIELKACVTNDIEKELIAFANTNGGTLYIGIADDGKILGVSNPDQEALRVSNSIRDGVKPDMSSFIHYETLDLDGKHIIRIDVQKGTCRPYYLAVKGLRPEGVYVRQGFSSVSATDSAIREMIKEADDYSYEETTSLNQSLTFEYCKNEFSKRGIKLEREQMRTLRMLSPDNSYTNLGLLLSDQCPYTIKIAIFDGENQTNFQDRREFGGSLLRQLNEAYEYIEIHNQTRADFEGLLRIDSKNYPDMAIREALLNSIIHRDYSYNASTLISVYSNRMEFVSVGGLPRDIDLQDIMLGISVCKNPNLANAFYRLGLIEAYGTGIKKIYGTYENAAEKPKIITTNRAFSVALPNINKFKKMRKSEKPVIKKSEKFTEIEKQVISYLKEHDSITRAQVQNMFSISQTSAGRILKPMVEEGVLEPYNSGRSREYGLKRTDIF